MIENLYNEGMMMKRHTESLIKMYFFFFTSLVLNLYANVLYQLCCLSKACVIY